MIIKTHQTLLSHAIRAAAQGSGRFTAEYFTIHPDQLASQNDYWRLI